MAHADATVVPAPAPGLTAGVLAADPTTAASAGAGATAVLLCPSAAGTSAIVYVLRCVNDAKIIIPHFPTSLICNS